MQGVLPLSANLDSIGPLAPSVRCCAALDAVLSGESQGELRAASLQGLRLLTPTNVVLDGMDSAVAAAWQRALSLLYAAGVQITEAVVPPFSELAQINAKGGFTAAEAWAWHRSHIDGAGRLAEYDPRVGTRILRGKDISAADYIEPAGAPPAVDCPRPGADGRSRPDAHAHGARDRAQDCRA